MHKSLYTIAVFIDLRGRIKGILSAIFVIIHKVLYLHRFLPFGKAIVVPLFCAAIAYADHTYSDRVCVVGSGRRGLTF